MAITHLENDAFQKLMAETPDLQLLDVRTPEEYYGLGHIPGSQLLPIHELPGRLETLNAEAPLAVVCEHGVRSAHASEFLAYQGFKQIYNLMAGMAEWNGPREFAS